MDEIKVHYLPSKLKTISDYDDNTFINEWEYIHDKRTHGYKVTSRYIEDDTVFWLLKVKDVFYVFEGNNKKSFPIKKRYFLKSSYLIAKFGINVFGYAIGLLLFLIFICLL
jgi:hypothetical protein